ncbi:MAG: 5-amino-6-(D-ribitylamino)uracil--L-tyrosine 4-hydroxyphenyl transferase CofH [Rhodobacteraceae bacterium]|nr:5-amino-6-(D-ribitylamino)uracil--L-tyrosine 4-hydroxyphenyl transferase CofH [Paracoccaceae bacterium]
MKDFQLTSSLSSGRLGGEDALGLIDAKGAELDDLIQVAASLRDQGHGDCISYSRNVFVPLTKLCRDVCHYCTFSRVSPSAGAAYLSPDEVLEIARQGAQQDCKELLFTLGDKPELRYQAARDELAKLGHATTISYLVEVAGLVQRETGLLVHVNPGVATEAEMAALRQVSVSQGMMLESLSERLCAKGGPHFGSPDKYPAARLEVLEAAGRLKIPFTSGLLIGIGETRAERIEALLALRDLNDRHGHIQELIIQNFKPKANTRMANHPAPDAEELIWTIAITRLMFGEAMNIQAPPNLLPGNPGRILNAGINDWGGVSAVTPDFVNPEAPWPHLDQLALDTAKSGKILVERLAVYPPYVLDANTWQDKKCAGFVRANSDSEGMARTGSWYSGKLLEGELPLAEFSANTGGWLYRQRPVSQILAKAETGRLLNNDEVSALLTARGSDVKTICSAADDFRRTIAGDVITYVVNRNINYTNICNYRCTFCAFSKGKTHEDLRGKPYLHGANAIVDMASEGVNKGATEVCLQGGIHPDYTGDTYLGHCGAIKRAYPDLHIHAFSPLEIWHGAQSNKVSVREFLQQLKAVGLGSLPGTAAEILDDEVRAVICPDKLDTETWLQIVKTAHEIGIPTTATIMFGHVEKIHHVAGHLLKLRDLQIETGGFTELVPLPFVHMESPMALKGQSRRGPTFREALLVHAAARITLYPHFRNIQTSWTKMGVEGAHECLNAGANDLGGTLMSESISRAAGAEHGQEFTPDNIIRFIEGMGRIAQQRNTLYGRIGGDGLTSAAAE